MADRLSDIRLRACLDHLKGWQREPGSWIADCAVALIELIERRAVETTTCQFHEEAQACFWSGCPNKEPTSPATCPLPWPRAAVETAAAPVVNAAGTGAYDVPQFIETNEDGSPLKTGAEHGG